MPAFYASSLVAVGALSIVSSAEAWQPANVTDLQNALLGCAGAADNDATEWQNWNGTGCTKSGANMEDWDTSLITSLKLCRSTSNYICGSLNGGLFFGAKNFNGNVTKWNTGAVTDMSRVFSCSSGYEGVFNQDLSDWDVSKVKNMYHMFSYQAKFNQDLSDWKVSQVTNTRSMFAGAASFNQNLSSWDTSQVTDSTNMWSYATAFKAGLGSKCGNSDLPSDCQGPPKPTTAPATFAPNPTPAKTTTAAPTPAPTDNRQAINNKDAGVMPSALAAGAAASVVAMFM